MSNQVDEFFEGLPSEDKKLADVLEEKPEVEEKKEEEVEEQTESRKNRHHRRLEEQLQRERDSNIALNERVKVLSEINRVSKEYEIDPRLVKVFGTTDEGKEVAQILSTILEEKTEFAKEQALREFADQKEQELREEREESNFIDRQLESIEDSHNIDITSDSPKARKTRREFLQLVESLSPKDENGDITEYADFGSAYDVYQATHSETSTASRQKEIASKSMSRSSSQSTEGRQVTPGFRGWQKDYNLDN